MMVTGVYQTLCELLLHAGHTHILKRPSTLQQLREQAIRQGQCMLPGGGGASLTETFTLQQP